MVFVRKCKLLNILRRTDDLFKKSRSHAAWHSNCSVPPRHHLGMSRIKKWQKLFENQCLGHFGETFLGAPNRSIKTRKALPCSVALIPFCAEAFPCSVALVFRFGVFLWKVQHGPNEGVRNMYKTNTFLHVLKTDRKIRVP